MTTLLVIINAKNLLVFSFYYKTRLIFSVKYYYVGTRYILFQHAQVYLSICINDIFETHNNKLQSLHNNSRISEKSNIILSEQYPPKTSSLSDAHKTLVLTHRGDLECFFGGNPVEILK